MSTFTGYDSLSSVHFNTHIGNDFTNGNRGMARAVKGAKKFINSRRRFHERMALHDIERQA